MPTAAPVTRPIVFSRFDSAMSVSLWLVCMRGSVFLTGGRGGGAARGGRRGAGGARGGGGGGRGGGRRGRGRRRGFGQVRERAGERPLVVPPAGDQANFDGLHVGEPAAGPEPVHHAQRRRLAGG